MNKEPSQSAKEEAHGIASNVDEAGRWQEAIYQLLLKYAPDNVIDGAGCDSGDPLDFTITEIGQALNHIQTELDEALLLVDEMSKHMVPAYPTTLWLRWKALLSRHAAKQGGSL